MDRTTLDTLDLDGLAAAFNRVYEGYVMPVQAPAGWISRHVHTHDIDLRHSPLWSSDAGEVVGLAMLGVRDDRGWVGGFGIAPGYRGQGLSHALISEVIDAARQLGLRRVQLEVIVGNERAIKSYERGGFVRQRDLLILARDPNAHMLEVDTSVAQPADIAAILDTRARLQLTRPAWQREPASIAKMTGLEALAVGTEGAPLAFAIFGRGGPSLSFVDIGMLDTLAAQAVVAALVERSLGHALTLINEPEDSDIIPVLEDAGWREEMRQYEMVYEL